MNKRVKVAEIKAKIMERLWSMLAVAVIDDNDWPTNLSGIVTAMHDLLDVDDSDHRFQEKFREMFADGFETIHVELELSPIDRAKILKDLDDQCLSNKAKESIRKALG